MKRRLAQLPLHGGKAPAWLFKRMTHLAGAVTMAVVDAHGPEEMLRRLAEPWWFQAFGCALGFDWHSSGLTTVTCGALKDASRRLGADLGIVVAGGKGKTSRKTPDEIDAAASAYGIEGGAGLIHASRMSAKVDSAAVQDGYQVYHHSFFFTPGGAWCVVQQGMNGASGWARRYHWLGESVDDFVCEPHQGIQDAQGRAGPGQRSLLNMVAGEAGASREACAALIKHDPDSIVNEIERLTEGPTLFAPAHHPVLDVDVNLPRLRKIVRSAHEADPADFATLLGTQGVGPATVRSLALLAELIYEAPAARRDPAEGRRWADYSYAHGGKDGFPFPVDRETYDRSIDVLLEAVNAARLGDLEKVKALERLAAV